MGIFAPGAAQGINASMEQQHQYGIDAEVMAERKAKAKQDALTNEQAQQDRATTLRAQQGAMQTMQGMNTPPPPQTPPPGQASVPAQPPPQMFSQQGQAAMSQPPGGAPQQGGQPPPGQPQQGQQPGIPPYRTVAQGMPPPQQQQPAPQGPPPGAPQQGQPQQQGSWMAHAIQQMTQAGVPDDQMYQQIVAMKPMMDEQRAEQAQQIQIQQHAAQVARYAYEDSIKKANEERQVARDAEQNRHNRATEGASQQRINIQVGNAGAGPTGSQTAPKTGEDLSKIAAKFGISQKAFEIDAKRFHTDGTLPSTMRSQKNLPYINAVKDLSAMTYEDTDIAANKSGYKAYSGALTQTVNREAAVNRVIGAVKENQPKIVDLVKKLNTSLGGAFVNQSVNKLIDKFGDNKDLAELKNLVFAASREYVIATTMPGSNAQMFAAHADEAKDMLNMNMPMNKLLGALQGINEDMSASETALNKEAARLNGLIRGINPDKKTGDDKGAMSLDAYLKSKGH